MSTRLTTLCFDAIDPWRMAQFWAGALHWDISDQAPDEVALTPTDGTLFDMAFLRTSEPKVEKNQIHLDLVSESTAHQAEMQARLISLGARHVDIGQPAGALHVLADPEGNEFCVVVRGEFLANAGLLGAVVFEPANATVGYFWSEATGWPVVFDEDGDTAIRAPDGRGPFITFGPPIDVVKAEKGRLHLDVAPLPGGNQEKEVNRLIAAGARRVDIGQGDVSWVVLADPDDNEFCVLTPR